MGMFFNPENSGFASSVRSWIYVDKTKLIDFTNSVLGTEDRFVCVSRPRRFGKSMTVKMLAAYYSRGCDSRHLFQNLQISDMPGYEKNLNQHNVIDLDMQWFHSIAKDKGIAEQTVPYMQTKVIRELRTQYPDILSEEDHSLPEALLKIHASLGEQFIIIIDEWDCIFREEKNNTAMQESYINFLRGLLKGIIAETYIELAYITGILPVKKYGTQSALNNFDEYTMISPAQLELFIGFTEDEVLHLCKKYHLDFQETRYWYDGYVFHSGLHVYNPKSVSEMIKRKHFDSYWAQTETYESLKYYINLNYNGLRDDILKMLDGDKVEVDTGAFQNDLVSFQSKDDVLTLLVHLGYLAYHEGSVFIPNEEVKDEFFRTVRNTDWDEIIKMTQRSDQLIKATLDMDQEQVARMLDEAHQHPSVSHLKYNDENSLCYVITNAYFCAAKDYIWVREMPAGKGFADIVYLPKRGHDKPAIVVDLKWNKSAEGAINQIKNKQYPTSLKDFSKDILLVGINYDKKTKTHTCVIEKI